jgi:hypothetical protein
MEKFKVGDYIEALFDHQKSFKKGDRFHVLGTKNVVCKNCGKTVFSIDIGTSIPGFITNLIHTSDRPCQGLMGIFTEVWFSQLNFKLVQDPSNDNNEEVKQDFKPISYTKILEEVQLSES